MPANSGEADYPFNSLPPPGIPVMKRYQYDPNNDGIVDSATGLTDTNVRTQNGFLQIRQQVTGNWFYLSVANDGTLAVDANPPTMP